MNEQMNQLDASEQWKEFYVVAEATVDEDELESEDKGVAGVYLTLVSSSCKSPATAALDCFHENVAVAMLEDFNFSVVDPEACKYVDEVEGAESYTMGDMARFEGMVMDELPEELVASLYRSGHKEYFLVVEELVEQDELADGDIDQEGIYSIVVNPANPCPATAVLEVWDRDQGLENSSHFRLTVVDPNTGEMVKPMEGAGVCEEDIGELIGEVDWPLSQEAWDRLFGPDGLAHKP